MTNRKISIYWVALLAASCCMLVYLRALGCGFVWFDDPDYVYNNQSIRHLDRNLITWAFTHAHAGFWMPLTWLSFALDYFFWQLDPFGYHLTNIVLHAVNVFLVVLIADQLSRMMPGGGERTLLSTERFRVLLLFAGAMLFGIHPLRVESVVWIAERKDVLNGCFTLGSILFYLSFIRKAAANASPGIVRVHYGVSLLLFTCSLLVKSVSVVVPFMLLVLDWYPLNRLQRSGIKRILLEKLPFMFFSGFFAALTLVVANKQGILFTASDFPLLVRCVVAGNALFEYCRLTLVPYAVLPFYVLEWKIPLSFILKAGLMALFTLICLWNWRRRPWLPAGWLLFVLPLLPTLGFFQNGDQAFAARFTYLGSAVTGIFLASLSVQVAREATFFKSKRLQRLLLGSAFSLAMMYAVMTIRLIPVWDNPGTFWSRVIELKPLGRAYQERGLYYYSTGKLAAAADDLTAAIEIARSAGVLGFNLVAHRGAVFMALKRYDLAIEDFTTAIEMYPSPRYYYHRGLAFQASGNRQKAAADFSQAGGDSGPIEWLDAVKK